MRAVMFCRLNIIHDIRTGKIPAVFVMSFFLVRFFFSGFENYLVAYGQKIQAVELFSFSLTSPVTYLFFFFGMMILLSGNPRIEGDTLYYLIRSKRVIWLIGQYLYVLFCVIAYLSWLLFCYASAVKWQVVFSKNWSEPIYFVSQTGVVQNVGIGINVWFPYELLLNYSPYSLFFTIFLLQILLFFLLGAIQINLTIFGHPQLAYVLIVLLWLQAFVFQQFDVKPVFWKLSLVLQSWPAFWNYGYLKGAPKLNEVLGIYIITGSLLVILSKIQVGSFDMTGRELKGRERDV